MNLEQYQANIQEALSNLKLKPYGKLTNLLNNAHRCGLITTNQLIHLDKELEKLRLGNNNVDKSNFVLNGDMAQQFNESFDEDDFWGYDEQQEGGL
jgi:hypothetical protein